MNSEEYESDDNFVKKNCKKGSKSEICSFNKFK